MDTGEPLEPVFDPAVDHYSPFIPIVDVDEVRSAPCQPKANKRVLVSQPAEGIEENAYALLPLEPAQESDDEGSLGFGGRSFWDRNHRPKNGRGPVTQVVEYLLRRMADADVVRDLAPEITVEVLALGEFELKALTDLTTGLSAPGKDSPFTGGSVRKS